MNKFNIIVLAASVILAVIALLLFSGIIPGFRSGAPAQAGTITVWGPLSKELFAPAIADFQNRFKDIRVTYREMNPSTYIENLVDAFASAEGPDIFLLPHDQILKQKDRIYVLAPSVYPLRTFRDGFLDLGGLFATETGVMALPFYVDPLVLYWNRDLFQSASIAKAPAMWNEFSSDSQKLKHVEGSTVIQAGAALGDFTNIRPAKDIVSLLMLQNGNPVVDPATRQAVFANRKSGLSAGEEAVLLFNSFADPRKDTYTWNRSMPDALDAFSSGQLAMYIGYASDLETILAKNPHLNFDVAEAPQNNTAIKATYARSYGLAVSKQSRFVPASLTFIYDLTSFNQQKLIAENSLTPPTLRTLLATPPENPALEVFYAAAVKARAWLDPDPARTGPIFQEMSSSALSGSKRLDAAVEAAQNQINALFPKN